MVGVIQSGRFGAAAFTPASLSPLLWLDASDAATITSSGGKVSQWADKGPNGHYFGTTDADEKPTTGATTQNGLNVLNFNSANWLVADAQPSGSYNNATTAAKFTAMHDGTPYIIAMVSKLTSAGVNTAYLGNIQGNSNQRGMWVYHPSNQKLWFYIQTGSGYTSPIDARPADSSTSPRIHVVLADPGNATASNRSYIRQNGSAASRDNAQTATPSTSAPGLVMVIGGIPNSASVIGYGLWGWMAELVIVTGANATDANAIALRDYLNEKWAVY